MKKKIPNIEGPLEPAFLWDFSNVLLCAERVPREERAAAWTDVLNRARVAVGIQAYAEYFDALRSLVSASFGKGRHVLFVPETVQMGNGKPVFRMYDQLAWSLVASGKFSALRFDKKDLDSEMMRFAKTLKARWERPVFVSNDTDFRSKAVRNEAPSGSVATVIRFPWRPKEDGWLVTERVEWAPEVSDVFSERFASALSTASKFATEGLRTKPSDG